MLKKGLAVLIMVFISVPCASGYETLSTVFVDGTASMVMDGNLDDWEPYDLPAIPVTHPIEKTRSTAEVIATHGDADCAFSFKCFADQKFVYFALIVKDDEVIVGQNGFGYGWLEDSNTLYFDGDCVDIEKPYFDANDGQLKVIGDPPNGIKYIEGDTPYFLKVIPYFWEARGILSGFQMTSDGYVTEIAIPADVLGWGTVKAGRQMGANLRVVDMDSDVNPDEVDKGFIWAPDPDHTAHVCTKSYNRISFSTTVPATSSSAQPTLAVQTDGGISVTLGMPDLTKGRAILNSVLTDLAIPDFAAAEAKLLPVQDEMWVKPLLGYIQLKKGDIETGTNQLIDFGKECPYPWAEEYIQVFLKECVYDMLRSFKGEKDVITYKCNDYVSTIIELFLNQYIDQNIVTSNNIKALEYTSSDANSLKLFNIAFNRCDNNDDKLMILKCMLRLHLRNGDYANVETMYSRMVNFGLIAPDDPVIIIYNNLINQDGE